VAVAYLWTPELINFLPVTLSANEDADDNDDNSDEQCTGA